MRPVRIKSSPDGISVSIKVKPGAKKNSISVEPDCIRVKISEPPVDGKANAKLVDFFSEILDLPKSAIRISRGSAAKNKTLNIRGISEDFFLERISE
jgi:uncharacterized protein (TIGR00251 family)